MNKQESLALKPAFDIAVIGMTGRFPGAKNINEFWQNLCNGVESISFFSEQELLDAGISPSVLNHRSYVKASPILEDIEFFDASFFGFSPREAELTDPQHRIFIECVWEALENAGYYAERYKGSIALYAGSGLSSYLIRNLVPNEELVKSVDFFQIMIGNDKDHLTPQASYKLNLKGPSVNLNNACSTSLIAVHMACQSLLNNECDMALAGGITINCPHKAGYFYEKGMIVSPDGHCRTFDAKAQGTILGNGVGIVVLKRLEDALIDGDSVLAVIKGSAVNNDGSAKMAYTAPSVEGQAKVIAEALAVSGIDPETITCIEAHGTATALGDPIEVTALTRVFRSSTQKKGYCAIGSVKTNIGHAVTASGVAGLIKTVLALKHKMIPPSLHFEEPNPEIDFANSPFYVNTKLSEWKTDGTSRRAGVSSFGIGGTNAHVVLEEAPPMEPSGESRPTQLLMLSAKTDSALNTMAVNLAEHLRQHPDINLADVAYTLQVGRKVFDHRRVMVCHDVNDAATLLETCDPKQVLTAYQEHVEKAVVFMFSGQGAQYVNMALELYHIEAAFREQVDLCSELLLPHLGIDLRNVLYPAGEQTEKATEQLKQTAIAQPSLFVIEYALAKLWMQWGISPQAMIGHGIGEYVAACLAGVFSVEEALALVVAHGQMENNNLDTESFVKQVKNINLNPPKIPCVSHNTGTWITEEDATDTGYWAESLQQTTRIAETIRQLFKKPEQILLEVGPGQTLNTLATQHPDKTNEQVVLSSIRHPQEQQSDVAFLLNALSRLWLAGANIDWLGFYTHEQRHRLPLPTYPFERKRYWVDPPKQDEKAKSGEQTSLRKKPDIADWFYAPSWSRSVVPVVPSDKASLQADWLVFTDECGLGFQLVERLKQQDQNVISIRVGSEFAKLDEYTYTLNPQNHDDYDTLLNELNTQGKLPQKIVHLWNVTSNGQEGLGFEKIDKSQDLGFYSLLFLVQALGKQNLTNDCHITVVSNNLHEVTGEEILSPEKATLLGPVKVIPREYENVSCISIDVVFPMADTDLENKLVSNLLAELSTKPSDSVIAYRGVHRWVQSFEPIRLDESVKIPSRLREGGVYLITGGLGGIGLELAEYLARTVRAKLVLTGRSGLPPRDEWEQWLSAGEGPVETIKPADTIDLGSKEDLNFLSQQEAKIEKELGIRGLDSYEGLEQSLNELCSAYVYDYFRTSNINTEKGQIYDKELLKKRLKILPKFEKFYDFFVRILSEDQIIKVEGDEIKFVKSEKEIKDPRASRKDLEERYPEFKEMIRHIEYCVDHYSQALSGEIEAISVLYPDGSANLLRDAYSNTLEHSNQRVYTMLLKEIVSRAIRRSHGKKLRILEIGAGSGELTKFITPCLRNQNVEYHFTDIGKSFVLRAERETAESDFNFMKFGELDISKDPTKQGFENYSFDMIFGLNVVHATKDIEETMGHLKKLLASNGMIFLIEGVKLQRWVDMVWGLAEGWWYFEDEHIRSGSPLLSLEKWEKVMQRQGFKHVKVYPETEEKSAKTDCGLIIVQQETNIKTDSHVVENSGDEKQRVRNKINRLKRIEELGAEVLVLSANVSDLVQMQSVLTQAKERFGQINGVIHAAAIESGRAIQLKSFSQANDEFGPKIRGTLVLDTLLRDTNLDFMVLCSSVSSIIGAGGQVGYSAANAFLDAFAHYRAAEYNTFTLTVNWDIWQNVGLAVVAEALHKAMTGEELNRGMTAEEGIEAFSRIIFRNTLPQILVSPHDFEGRIKQPTFALGIMEKSTGPYERKVLHPRPNLSYPYVAPTNGVEQMIGEIMQEILGIEKVGINDNYFDIGGDSLIAVTIGNKIQERLGEVFHITALFDSPSVAELAVYLGKHYPQAVTKFLGPEAESIAKPSIEKINAAKVNQMREMLPFMSPRQETSTRKNRSMVFILSAPRCGSTLLRVILAGHPQLFAPPELELLLFNTLEERKTALRWYTLEGTVRAIMQIKDCNAEQAQEIMREFEERKTTTKQFYNIIQEWLGNRILVDKSPPYALYLNILNRAEADFENPLYIHLLRHPCAMIASYEEIRLALLLGKLADKLPFSERELAELAWVICQQNIIEFLKGVPQHRQCCIKFEDLVKNPQSTVESICQFLNLDFQPEMLQPYKDKKERMTDGIKDGSRMIGDLKFHQHKAIDAEAAESWKNFSKDDFLGDITWQIAESFGYQRM